MELLFLGTSSGAPTQARNVSGLALLEDSGKGWYLIDCGEATQHRLHAALSSQNASLHQYHDPSSYHANSCSV